MTPSRGLSKDTFGARRRIDLPDGSSAHIFDLQVLARAGVGRVDRLPFSIRLLLENLLRHEDGAIVTAYYFNERPDGERFIGATIWLA